MKLIDDATASADLAMAEGAVLMEVEFPPVPVSKLEDSALSAYDILGANLNFAVEFAKRLKPKPKYLLLKPKHLLLKPKHPKPKLWKVAIE